MARDGSGRASSRSRMGHPLRAPPISRPIRSTVAVRHRHRRREPAAAQHRDAVADLEQLVEFLAHHQHAGAGRAGRSGPGGSPARRRHRRPRSAAPPAARAAPASISRPTMNFCRLPPERLRACAAMPAQRTSKRRDQPGRQRVHRCQVQQAARAPWRRSTRVSSAFSASDSSGTAPRPSRSSGTKARPRARRSAGPSAPIGWPSSRTAPGAGAALARQRRQQLLLAVAGDAGDADDLAGAHLERDVAQRRCRTARRRQGQARRPPGRARRAASRRRRWVRQVAADHQLGSDCRGLVPRVAARRSPGRARSTVQRSHSARISSSLWLM